MSRGGMATTTTGNAGAAMTPVPLTPPPGGREFNDSKKIW